jgi:aspartyl-tRNA(Asn)/glutamyl-tRNA(Gln) amidotransferase subunit B
VTTATKNTSTAYEAVIGLEVHVQLQTATKIFCGCSTRFGDPPSTNVCPVCLGLPGALPVVNRQVVELAVRAALALNLQVRQTSVFARKNYFYPDLPKGYQISQFDKPLAEQGWLEAEVPKPGGKKETYTKRVNITRLHIEEDAGKSLHDGFPESDSKTYLDFNRCGVPLAEIVSEPDMRTPEEAYAYLTTLKQILQYAGISDCDMEKGSLRCDANISLRPKGTEKFGVKTEVKNLNSFRYLVRALEYEIERQTEVLEDGGKITQETRLWDQPAGETKPMRSKEFAHDYRYFPEPDLLPLLVDDAWLNRIRDEMPELPVTKKARFIEQYALTPYDADVLTATQALADYFEAAAGDATNVKAIANWVQGSLLAALNNAGKEIADSPVPPERLTELVTLVEDGTLSGKMAKTVFEKMFSTGQPPMKIIETEGMEQITDSAEIERLCREAIEANPEKAEAFRQGNQALMGLFVGQVMKASRGQANPKQVNEILRQLLG